MALEIKDDTKPYEMIIEGVSEFLERHHLIQDADALRFALNQMRKDCEHSEKEYLRCYNELYSIGYNVGCYLDKRLKTGEQLTPSEESLCVGLHRVIKCCFLATSNAVKKKCKEASEKHREEQGR